MKKSDRARMTGEWASMMGNVSTSDDDGVQDDLRRSLRGPGGPEDDAGQGAC